MNLRKNDSTANRMGFQNRLSKRGLKSCIENPSTDCSLHVFRLVCQFVFSCSPACTKGIRWSNAAVAGSPNSRQRQQISKLESCLAWKFESFADGTYATLGSYALTAVIGRADLAPTAWRLEGVEPGSTQRQILDEAACLQSQLQSHATH